MSYNEVFDKIIDSKDVTVGGGSASAIAGAMAAGLIGMVSRLSTKKDYGLPAEKYLEAADELDQLAKDLLIGAEKDTQAFCLIKAAYALPKETEEEKLRRSSAIEKAGIAAAEAPKNNAFKCRRVYELGLLLNGKSNINAASDITIGINLSYLGIMGCVANIEANLSMIKDEKVRNEFENHIKTLKNSKV